MNIQQRAAPAGRQQMLLGHEQTGTQIQGLIGRGQRLPAAAVQAEYGGVFAEGVECVAITDKAEDRRFGAAGLLAYIAATDV